jgi:ABC-type cobalamin/Fe3+-siderophores transport system ATPase subunit
MVQMKFLKLSLLSQKERRALQIDLSAQRTVLVAGNGCGKSAILKSLYEAFGAKPHKVDVSWTDAAVTTLVEFKIGGIITRHSNNKMYSVFLMTG